MQYNECNKNIGKYDIRFKEQRLQHEFMGNQVFQDEAKKLKTKVKVKQNLAKYSGTSLSDTLF